MRWTPDGCILNMHCNCRSAEWLLIAMWRVIPVACRTSAAEVISLSQGRPGMAATAIATLAATTAAAAAPSSLTAAAATGATAAVAVSTAPLAAAAAVATAVAVT